MAEPMASLAQRSLAALRATVYKLKNLSKLVRNIYKESALHVHVYEQAMKNS